MADDRAENISIKELYNRSHAIVIGISNYQDKKLRLKNPINDAKQMVRVLKKNHGFDDIELVLDADATREKLAYIFEDRIRGNEVTKDDRLLVYYSGHGQVRTSSDQQGRLYEESYIIPFDAKLGSYASYLNLDTVTKNCQRCSAKHVLLILDSCYSGTAFIEGRNLEPVGAITDEYLRRITSKRCLQAMAATDKVQVAIDSGLPIRGLSAEHGAFTGCLLDILRSDFDPDKDGILTASEVGAYLEKNVPRNDIPQNPIYGHLPGSEVGEFIFNVFSVSKSKEEYLETTHSRKEYKDLIQKGDGFYYAGQTKSAIECFDKAIELDPNEISAWYRKGIVLHSMNKLKQAIECFDKAIELDPNEISAWYRKGTALSSLQKLEDAIVCYDKALELDPNSPKIWFMKGVSLANMMKFEDAIVCYDKALELDPNDSNLWSQKAVMNQGLQKLEDAIVCYDKMIELDPNDSRAWSSKGHVLYDLHKFEDAIVCYDKALELDPNNSSTKSEKEAALRSLGKF